MLYWLTALSDGGDVFNLFRYITFRAGGAFFTALFFGFFFGKPLINVFTFSDIISNYKYSNIVIFSSIKIVLYIILS